MTIRKRGGRKREVLPIPYRRCTMRRRIRARVAAIGVTLHTPRPCNSAPTDMLAGHPSNRLLAYTARTCSTENSSPGDRVLHGCSVRTCCVYPVIPYDDEDEADSLSVEEDRRPRRLTEIPRVDAATNVRPHVIETRGRSGGSDAEAAIGGAENIGVIYTFEWITRDRRRIRLPVYTSAAHGRFILHR